MIERKRLERLLILIEELKRVSEEGGIIVVEGRNDALALRKLGVKGETVMASSLPDSEIFRICSGKKTVILSDWDSKGKEIEMRLMNLIRNADISIWKEISGITGRYIHSVEELPEFIRKVREFYRL